MQYQREVIFSRWLNISWLQWERVLVNFVVSTLRSWVSISLPCRRKKKKWEKSTAAQSLLQSCCGNGDDDDDVVVEHNFRCFKNILQFKMQIYSYALFEEQSSYTNLKRNRTFLPSSSKVYARTDARTAYIKIDIIDSTEQIILTRWASVHLHAKYFRICSL